MPLIAAGDVDSVMNMMGSDPRINTSITGSAVGTDNVRAALRRLSDWISSLDATPRPLRTHRGFYPGIERIAHELVLDFTDGEDTFDLPILIVSDLGGDRAGEIRAYHSMWPLIGKHQRRAAILPHDSSIVTTQPFTSYEEAIRMGDPEFVDSLFEPDGYAREPSGERYRFAGVDRQKKFYEPILAKGGIELDLCTFTAAPGSVFIEFNAIKWAGADLGNVPGGAVYDISQEGRFHAARIYDDVDPPI